MYELPNNVDNTMLSTFSNCPRHFEYQFLMKKVPSYYNSGIPPIHLSFGIAIALSLEAMRKAYFVDGIADLDTIIAIGLIPALQSFGVREDHAYKNTHRLIEAIILYAERWPFPSDPFVPLELNGQKSIEVPFRVTFPDNPYFHFVGTSDMLGTFGNNIYTADEKTCSQMGDSWARSWLMRGQFVGYTWAYRTAMDIDCKGALVRGICMTKEIQLQQAIVPVSTYMCDSWYYSNLINLKRIEEYNSIYKFFPMNFSESCKLYGGCPYKNLCLADSVQHKQYLLETEFISCHWDPIKRENTYGD